MRQPATDYRQGLREIWKLEATRERRETEARAEQKTLEAMRIRRREKVAAQEAGSVLRFEPNALYPLDHLERMLKGTMALKTFMQALRLDRTGKGRILQYAVFGHEILQAMQNMADSDKTQETAPEAHSVIVPRLPRKPGRPRKQPMASVHAIARKAEAPR